MVFRKVSLHTNSETLLALGFHGSWSGLVASSLAKELGIDILSLIENSAPPAMCLAPVLVDIFYSCFFLGHLCKAFFLLLYKCAMPCVHEEKGKFLRISSPTVGSRACKLSSKGLPEEVSCWSNICHFYPYFVWYGQEVAPYGPEMRLCCW